MVRWLGLSLLVTLIFAGLVFVWSLPHIAQSAGGLRPFDLRVTGYSQADAQYFLQSLSDDGRVFYLNVHHRLDLLFPVSLAITVMLATRLMYRARTATILMFPILMATSFDFFENKMVAELLRAPIGQVDPVMIAGAEMWTLLKFWSLAALAIVLLFGFMRALWVKGWSFRGA